MGRKVFTVQKTKFEVDDRYTVSRAIGFGSYGYVCAGEDTVTGQPVAIKKIPGVFKDLIDGKRILREIKLLRHFAHENVLNVKDIMRPRSKSTFQDIYLVTELLDTDLHQVIKSRQPLTEEHHQYFFYQLLRGLKYIHSASVLHRDLKPSNLLVNSNCDLKVCDFGLARACVLTPEEQQVSLTEYVVTRWYRPPELLLLCTHYSAAVDVWGAGCILAELIRRKPLFPGRDYVHQLSLIFDIIGTPKSEEETAHVTNPEAVRYLRNLTPCKGVPFESVLPRGSSPLAADLLSKMLVFDPKKRISVQEALAHPYLANLHDEKDEPVAPHEFSFEFDKGDVEEPELRQLLWDECVAFNPEGDEEDPQLPVVV